MSAQKFDGSAFKSGQKEQWDSVADAWNKWWPSIEKTAGAASTALADAIGAGPGQRILDVSTGIGEPAVTLARRVGPEGSIVATDQSARMLAVAAERIKNEDPALAEKVRDGRVKITTALATLKPKSKRPKQSAEDRAREAMKNAAQDWLDVTDEVWVICNAVRDLPSPDDLDSEEIILLVESWQKIRTMASRFIQKLEAVDDKDSA